MFRLQTCALKNKIRQTDAARLRPGTNQFLLTVRGSQINPPRPGCFGLCGCHRQTPPLSCTYSVCHSQCLVNRSFATTLPPLILRYYFSFPFWHLFTS